MKRKILALACCLLLVVAVGACKKKEEKPPVPQAGMPGQMPPGHQVMMPKGEMTVTVPDSVKGKWKAVVLVVEDKATKKSQEFTVNLNSDLSVPNSNLKISVGEYLPDFKMEGLSLTSISNEPNNPAVTINIAENGKQVFPVEPNKKWGWLFLKFPNIHAFEHPKYSVMLKSGVKKG